VRGAAAEADREAQRRAALVGRALLRRLELYGFDGTDRQGDPLYILSGI